MANKPSEKSKLAFKLLIIVCSALLMLGFLLFAGKKQESASKIVTSNFVSYDLARAITKGTSQEVEMLVPAGTDLHHYEPTQQDIINAKSAMLFIYAGGESEAWVENIIDENMATLKLIDVKGLILLQEDGEEEIDEHFWTSIANYQLLLESVKNKMIEIDPTNAEKYKENAREYLEQLQEVNEDLNAIINNSNRKTLIFADRFPAKYFMNEYGLEYLAAFSGCAEDTEADAATIASLINTIRKEQIGYIFTIENSDKKTASTVSEATGAQILTFQSLQNISKDDFEKGKTYVDLMSENFEPLRIALE